MSSQKRALIITKNDFTRRLDGGSKRTAALVDELESANWRITWVACKPATSSREVRPTRRTRLRAGIATIRRAALLRSVSVAKWISFRSAATIDHLLSSSVFDVVILEHAQLYAYVPPHCQHLVADMHNVESALLENFAASTNNSAARVLARYEATRLRDIERRILSRSVLVSTVSEHDAALLASHGPDQNSRVVVASNGVDAEFFNVPAEASASVVFIGHLGWRPNVDGIRWFTKTIWPKIEAANSMTRLQIVGRAPDPSVKSLGGGRVSVTANVPSVLPFLASASCAIAPLLSAGGTRIKILEALAAGVPVVATSLGALGLEHLAGPYMVITDDPDEFADAVLNFGNSNHSRESIRDLVRDYSWHDALLPLVQGITQVAGDAG